MIEVLQKVTTFPLELIDIPIMDKLYGKDEIHRYYSDLITKKDKKSDIGSVNEDELTKIGENASIISENKKNPNTIKPILFKDDKITIFKKRFLTYNAIYDKLFANSLNVLEKTDEPTVIVFPIYDQTDKGRVDINPKATSYYYNKFEKIKKTIEFKNKENENENVCYIGLNVFTSEKKDEYKKYIKTQLDDIKKLIDDYNENVKQLQSKSPNPPKFIKNLLFIIDTDKKGLFTGFYKNQLSKEKQEILNKEYSSFLSSSGIRYRKVDDASITLTYNNVVSETKRFKQRTTVGIGPDFLSNKDFDEFITILKELYKKVTDKQYKDSLELKDNIKDFKIFYKLENADKVLEDKIQTGSNKLYYIHKKDKNNVIGSFLLVSEERGIYRFKEDASQYRIRIANESKTTSTSNTNSKPNDNKEMEVENEPNAEKESEEPTPNGAYDFAVQIKNKYGIFKYKNLDKNQTKKEILEGDIFPYLDKTEGKFKWFNYRDIDASLLNKEIIKYYSEILFDKKTLIEYLKSKNKYTDKTILAYEFLKINDSQELSDYCDFIHNKFKSNIIDLSPSGFDAFNPFKIKFDDNTIIKNIRDILFDTNTPIYLRASKQTKDTQRELSRDSYKIVTYKIFENFEKDESCQPKEDSKDRTNKCKTDWEEYTNKKGIGLPIIVVVTKENLKDVGLLKSKTDCKSKKNKLIYDYKKLFSNITRRLGATYLGGTKKITTKISGKISGKRRLKAKRYK